MAEKVILIVDDEEAHELIKEYLVRLNVEIYSAFNGKEEIEMYRELKAKGRKPDIVIMDLNLSGSKRSEDLIRQMRGDEIDGVKATKEIKKIDPDANVIGFTAYAHLEWREMLKKMGAKEVFGRDIGFDGFAKKIESVLKRNLS